jgi:hypothetical protein
LSAHEKFLDQELDWTYLAAVPQALNDGQFSPLVFRQVLDRGAELLKDRFVADEAIEDLVRDRARLVDIALRAAWVRHAGKFAVTDAANCTRVPTSTSWCCCRRATHRTGSRTSNAF